MGKGPCRRICSRVRICHLSFVRLEDEYCTDNLSVALPPILSSRTEDVPVLEDGLPIPHLSILPSHGVSALRQLTRKGAFMKLASCTGGITLPRGFRHATVGMPSSRGRRPTQRVEVRIFVRMLSHKLSSSTLSLIYPFEG